MASAFYSEDLTCSICQTLFTDPVNLLCGHSFCRQCITDVLSVKQQCPHCRTDVSIDVKCLPTSHILRSLAEKAKEAEKKNRDKVEVADLCPEHEEKLKLFCVTDQQLVCIICRDGERHEGHKFKPVKEAAASLRQELVHGLKNIGGDILTTESLVNTQKEEITKTKDKAQQLMIQIHRQFEEMHQFLRKREDEIKNELQVKKEDAVEKMSEMLNTMESALSKLRELEVKATSVLEVKDPEVFLKSWTEGNNMVAPEQLFRSRAIELQVVNPSVSMGPYESHLQFFVWKEMLQVIQPRAELLSLKRDSANLTVSGDGRSLFCTHKNKQTQHTSFQFGQSASSSFHGSQTDNLYFGSPLSFRTPVSKIYSVYSVNEFSSGHHYWEVDVGHRDYWSLGIEDHFLSYDGQKFTTCTSNINTELDLADSPRKIGIYLNCSCLKLSFYNATNMTHIHTMSSGPMAKPVSALFALKYRTPDHNPMTVCWY
ncbi:zinc-binding protein A33-like [Mastacembelus armatus]|uniref:zinc-binding protein A33-like n=1 Tax=Mastacembelus armatus TaxID=205130 RepID=UPI000E465A46|nr:zinc-binding protein A33-like [Mastacembelus armatus]